MSMLGIIMSIVNTLSLIIIHFYVKLSNTIQGTKWWVIGNACTSMGVFLLSWQDVLTIRSVSINIGNGLVVLGVIFIHIGIMRFLDRKVKLWRITLAFAAYTIMFVYFTYVSDDITYRIIVFSVIVAIYSILPALGLLININRSIKAATKLLGGILLVQGSFFAIRAIIMFLSISVNNLFDTSSLWISTYTISIISSYLTTLGLILMVMQKLITETKEAKERLQLIFNMGPDAVFISSLQTGVIAEVNERFGALTGFSKEEAIGETTTSLGLWNNPEERLKLVAELKKNVQCENFAIDMKVKDGSIIKASISAKLMDLSGLPHIMSVTRDITESKLSEQKLIQSEEKYRLLIENALESIIVVQDGKLKFCNPMATIVTGFSQDELTSVEFTEFIHHDDREIILSRNLQRLKGELTERLYHFRVICKDRQIKWVAMNSVLIEWEGRPASLNFLTDITQRRKSEQKILHLSYHDQLTGLYNRRFYEEECNRLDTDSNLPMTIVIGDVNGLKMINDSFGHVTGDELLKKVADVIKKGCRADDIIARLGGDEFVIVLPKTDALETERIIKRIKDLSTCEKVGSIDISISFGYETKTDKDVTIQELFKKAEDHMYKHKLFESPSMRGKTISVIMRTLYEKNKREEEHSHRVSLLCKRIGEALDLTEGKIEELKTVGLLHDIGKTALDEKLLNKQGKLTEDEWKEIKRHPEIGYRILSTVNEMADLANYVLYHHEKWDGQGYPKGLQGNEIPFVSRIIAIADTYDAMTSDRSYRSALPKEVVIAELERNSGIQFDPELVRVFIEKVVGPEPNGTIKTQRLDEWQLS